MTTKPTSRRQHPLIGRALHKVNEDASSPYRWKYQAHILDVFPSDTGELVLIQFFSAMDGRRTNCALVPLSELIGDLSHKTWIIYDTIDDMREAGDRMNEDAYHRMKWDRIAAKQAAESAETVEKEAAE